MAKLLLADFQLTRVRADTVEEAKRKDDEQDDKRNYPEEIVVHHPVWPRSNTISVPVKCADSSEAK